MTINARFDTAMKVSPVSFAGHKQVNAEAAADTVTKSQIQFVDPQIEIKAKPGSKPHSIGEIIELHLSGLDLSLDNELTSICLKA